MADVPFIPMGNPPAGDAPSVQRPTDGSTAHEKPRSGRVWQSDGGLSSAPAAIADRMEAFLAQAGFDRAPWLAVVLAGGIFAWFSLPSATLWIAAIAFSTLIALFAWSKWAEQDDRGHLRRAVAACALVFALGMALIWLRSETIGAPAIERPVIDHVQGYVLEREDQPARDRLRLTLAVRETDTSPARKIRINVPTQTADEVGADNLSAGAIIRARVRLMPPASPMLPGSYDFARAAWFEGLAATGSVIGPVEVVAASPDGGDIDTFQRSLSGHVRDRVGGPAGSIAAAFASGDRGSITEQDAAAMRDAGLTHLLSISGLHVSAVIAAAYFVTIKLLSLFPALALRVRLPLIAACAGALAGIGYTLLTGAQVPTVRSCAAAMLVLIALALGRDALSLRLVALAALFVMVLWPETVIGPSFQMSFCAVIAIVALHNSDWAKAFLAPRDEPWLDRTGRKLAILFITGLVIEVALMPIVLFHFHRAGIYGAIANVVAIPLVTLVSMPMIAIALVFDAIGLGAPFWWIVGRSLDILLAIAHLTSAQPGAVKLMPQISSLAIFCFALGGFWFALWTGKARAFGAMPVALGAWMVAATPIPDLLIGRDGRHVGMTFSNEAGEARLISLRSARSSYARDNLLELSGVQAKPIPLPQWPGARCSPEFCTVSLRRGGRTWDMLLARNRVFVEEPVLAAACAQADIVVADRYLPETCEPRWMKADRDMLSRTGGLAIDLESGTVTSVRASQGDHGWWRGVRD